MRIAVFGDVHGNLPALTAVLRDIDRHSPDLVVCLGDLAYKGPAPGECVGLIRGLGIPCVYGNTDVALLCVTPQGREQARTSRTIHPAELPYLRWHAERLSASALDYLARLPFVHELTDSGIHIQFVHASPQDCNTALTPEQLHDLAADCLVVGHTHRACILKREGKLLVTVGAVGFSLDGDWRASYAILDTDRLEVSLRRVEYSVDAAAALAQERAFCFDPAWYTDALRKGWWEPVPWAQRAAIDHFPHS